MTTEDAARVRARYAGQGQRQVALGIWEAMGPETKDTLLALLPDDWSFENKRILDFGCGNGRTLKHFLPEAETAELWGADIDADYLETLMAQCPQIHTIQCQPAPPLHLESGSFDLAWSISVFTHLTDESIPWLLELHRLLKPDGLLIATFMGQWVSEFVAGEPWDEDRVGMNVLQHTQEWEVGGPNVMMSEWWVRAHWGRAFQILEIAPRIHNMSWAVMRKREVDVSPAGLEQPADDPREHKAVRHNLRQVQRELELTRELGATLAADAVGEYERSRSWRMTRPLRSGARTARERIDRWRSR